MASVAQLITRHMLHKLAGRFVDSRLLDANTESREEPSAISSQKKEGIEAVTLHDLRRTVRISPTTLGVQLHIAERVFSHKLGVIGVYDRYQYLDEKRKALEQWVGHVEGL